MMRTASLALVLLLAAAAAVEAQVNVSAELVIAAPTGAGTRNLAFGAVSPMAGQTVQVDVPAVRTPISGTRYAGEFAFNVATNSGVDFAVSVPTQLTAAGRPPLPLSANGTQYGAHCVTVLGLGCTYTQFNPAAAGSVRVCREMRGNGTCHPNRVFLSGSELWVYIGGMLSVPPTAMPGTYTGTITLTIVQVY